MWFLVAMHVPYVAFLGAMATTGLGIYSTAGDPPLALPLVLVIAALQLRHSLAASRGERPRYWQWSFLLLLVLTYAPLSVFGYRWPTAQWFAIASTAMLLPRQAVAATVAAVLIGWTGWSVYDGILVSGFTAAQVAWVCAYSSTIVLMGGGGLYGAARLVRAIDDLRDARAELADLAVSRERLRISRDLHDLLGHTLSAVSLKGDLALRLLARDEGARAAAEIESLTAVARAALRDVQDVANKERHVSLAGEAEGAAGLLAAAGIDARIDVAVADAAPPVDELLGWTLREGVTNVLRHSAATACSITVRRAGSRVRMEIENDGAAHASTDGHGLVGLAARASALSGTAIGRPTGDGRFRLLVDVPEVMS
ncbi:MAG TPA: histidine kinase [Chloroflexota bacterium]|nr:histidine kinase [Chloroflexota bacterium]